MLSSLLSSGAVPPLPKFVSPAVSRHVKGYATPYSELEKAFTSASPKDAAKALTTHEAAFKADGCWGLAKQVASALGVRCVARLTDVYLTQPLPSVATAAGLEGADREDGAAKLVRRAVGNGSVGAKIDSRARVVAFAPPPPPGGDRSSARLLHGRIDDVLALVARVGAMDEAIELEARGGLWLTRRAAPLTPCPPSHPRSRRSSPSSCRATGWAGSRRWRRGWGRWGGRPTTSREEGGGGRE